MNIKQTIRIVSVAMSLLAGAISVVGLVPSYADCGGVQTAIINCSQSGGSGGIEKTGLWGILLITINILTAGVGILAVAGIVYGAILYMSSGGNPEQVKKARTVFTNVVIGVVAFGGMFALLNFLVPGGVFTR